MVTIDRVTIPQTIKRIATHADIYPFVIDDFSPEPKHWWPPVSPAIYWLVASYGQRIVGLFLFFPVNGINYDFHAAVLPWARGQKESRLAGLRAIEWMWKNTGCKRITGGCPSFNKRCLGWLRAIGFKEFGVNEKSFQKNGVLHDLVMVGISKPTEEE